MSYKNFQYSSIAWIVHSELVLIYIYIFFIVDRTELSSSPFITTTDPTPSKLGFDQVQFISLTGPCSSEKIISNSFEFCSGFIGLWVGIYIWLLYVFQYPRDICNQSIFAWHHTRAYFALITAIYEILFLSCRFLSVKWGWGTCHWRNTCSTCILIFSLLIRKYVTAFIKDMKKCWKYI